MTKSIAPEAVADLLRPGMTVFVQGAVGEPTPVLQALAARPEASDRVHYLAAYVPGINAIDPAGFHANARLTTFFIYDAVAKSFAAGKVRFMPLHYSGIAAYMTAHPPVDLALIQVSPPDAQGRCSLGLSVDFVPLIVMSAKQVVAEVNAQMPHMPGSPTLPMERFDFIVESDRPLIPRDDGPPTETMDRVADNVAALVRDGDCIQIGIGKLPSAILARLHDKNDLGLQGGMIADGVIDLVEDGVLTGDRKSIDVNVMVCGVAIGSKRLYQWVRGRDDILFRPATYTHDPRIVSALDNFVSINSVLEVDLSGQANAEMLAGRQVSGTGGLVDFIRSARMARDGRSILALGASAARAKVSRIVSKLGDRSVVSGLRADVDYVVTEFGAARLKDKSIDERAEALMQIAAPDFRDELAAGWAEQKKLW